MTSEIREKLKRFLTSMPFTEECQVVYLLVEIRKLLDHENNSEFPIIRFYADWSVHTAKDRITPQIRTKMEAIFQEIKMRELNKSFADPEPKLIPFLSMMSLRSEMDKFLQQHSLPGGLIIMKANWPAFQGLLAGVLADQPINNPCAGIRKFSFKPAAAGRAMAEIEYELTPAVYNTLKIDGTY